MGDDIANTDHRKSFKPTRPRCGGTGINIEGEEESQ
jgi:hypothetical protein